MVGSGCFSKLLAQCLSEKLNEGILVDKLPAVHVQAVADLYWQSM